MTKKYEHKKILIALVVVLAVFNVFSFKSLFNTKIAEAQTPDQTVVPENLGSVLGYAWSASTDAPYSGVGWLNFNCQTAPDVNNDGDPCNDAAGNWGIQMNLEDGNNLGNLSGYAWSDNFGWLSFNPSDTSICFSNTTNEAYQHSAKAEFGDGSNDTLDITGWARFISAGQAGNNSGDWDGCVSFKGDNSLGAPSYTTTINVSSGELDGYAWGSSVVGWISFGCIGCDAHVILSSPSINLWADPTSVEPGGSTTLHWQANSYVSVCTTYANSNNYPSWQSGTSPAPSSISLPNGSAVVSGINATTTYTLNCKDALGQPVPQASVTVTVNNNNSLCTDPLANNTNQPLPCTYSPKLCADQAAINTGQPLPCTYDARLCADQAATNTGQPLPCTYDARLCADQAATNTGQPLPCTYLPSKVHLNLVAGPDVLVAASGNYETVLHWASDFPTAFTGQYCTGTASMEHLGNTSIVNVSNWSGNNVLHLPNSATGVNLGDWVSSPDSGGDKFTFTISCNSTDGVKTKSTVVNIQKPFTPPQEAPIVDFKIISPNQFPTDYYHEEIPLTGLDNSNQLKLQWQAKNVSECHATNQVFAATDIFDPTNPNPIGSLPNNTNWTDSPAPPEHDIAGQTLYYNHFPVLGPSINNTVFTISCTPADTDSFGTEPIKKNVCMSVAGREFPQCPVTSSGGTPPTYQEI
jgi:hypothetical protein